MNVKFRRLQAPTFQVPTSLDFVICKWGVIDDILKECWAAKEMATPAAAREFKVWSRHRTRMTIEVDKEVPLQLL